MSYGAGDRLSKNQRREDAREKSRLQREEQKKRERRNKLFLQGGLIIGVLAIVAVVVLIFTSTIKPASSGPKNMLSDGIKIGQDYKAVTTAALAPNGTPVPSKSNSSDVIAIDLYIDYQCPICGQFEAANADQISTWVGSGAATVEYHPIAILDRVSLGTNYSTRSANAAACVANYSPDEYFAYSDQLFANQPEENTTGLPDSQLISLAKTAKVKNIAAITTCINDQKFKSWVSAATTRATTGPIAGTDVAKVEGTPTVIINGKKYTGAINNAEAFAAAVATAAGQSFNANPTPTPTATPAK